MKPYKRMFGEYCLIVGDPHTEQNLQKVKNNLRKELIEEYKSFIGDWSFLEAIIKPTELNQIIKYIEKYSKFIIQEEDNIIDRFNFILNNSYKIYFIDTGDYSDKYILEATQPNNEIVLYMSTKINDIYQNKNNFDLFLKSFSEIVGHEIIHRLQKSKARITNIFKDIRKNSKGKIDFQRYLSSKQEIMSYSFQAIEWYRNAGYDDSKIIALIKNRDKAKETNSFIKLYHDTFFISDSPIIHRFYKYMYEYLVK